MNQPEPGWYVINDFGTMRLARVVEFTQPWYKRFLGIGPNLRAEILVKGVYKPYTTDEFFVWVYELAGPFSNRELARQALDELREITQ